MAVLGAGDSLIIGQLGVWPAGGRLIIVVRVCPCLLLARPGLTRLCYQFDL